MGKNRKRRVAKRPPKAAQAREQGDGPGFAEAVAEAQRESASKFTGKFGTMVDVKIEDGKMHVGLAKKEGK